jgi:hypothetical protein
MKYDVCANLPEQIGIQEELMIMHQPALAYFDPG